ncbi:MAG: protein kinase domain-containing protein [Blastocatellia bacterium]
MLQTGMILNQRYEIVRLIARGGMGAVYEGRDLKFGGSPVAIKRCLPANESIQRAFAREAELLANLSHPGVPKVRDSFAEAEARYLVMEYIPGRDLEEILKDRGAPIPTEEALEWMDQALDALNYMHSQRPPVIHRDIKTSNLKLTPLGHVMLIDFGLSKENGSTSLVGYSVNFAPLEQLQGDGTDARSDLYSLGATIYRLLTGLAPESALNRLNQMAKDHRDPLPRVNAINSQVPAAVAQVIWEAMALDREDRLQSADEMRGRLREARKSPAENFQQLYAPTEAIQAENKASSVSGLNTSARSIAHPRVESSRESSTANAQGASLPPGLANIGTSKSSAKNVKVKLALSLACLVAFVVSIGAGVNYWETGQEAARQKAARQIAEHDEIAGQKAAQLKLAQDEAERQKADQSKAVQDDAERQMQTDIQRRAADQEAERRGAAQKEAERQRQEAQRREAAQKEAERQRQEAERREAAQKEAERQKQEAQRREAAQKEAERQRHEAERREAERQRWEAERREAERQRRETERREAERQRREAERREAERQRWEAERREAEKQRWEAERREAERQKWETERREAAKKEAEKQKAKKEAKEKKEREPKDRLIKGAIIGGIAITTGIISSQKAKNKSQP